MNRKSVEERAKILQCLVEGNSIRSTGRLRDCSKDTVLKLLVEVGEACADYQDRALHNLPCTHLQVDEIWSFVRAKAKNMDGVRNAHDDVWTWTAICADTKIIPAWSVGTRDAKTAQAFIKNLSRRVNGHVQITSDGLAFYKDAVENAFHGDADYAMLEKHYGRRTNEYGEKYGKSQYLGSTRKKISGNPDLKKATTSYVERANLTMRMGIRRFTRETNAFSKKLENHCWAIALHFMYYNFVRVHKSLRVTPAMAAGVTPKLWELEDVVRMADKYWDGKR